MGFRSLDDLQRCFLFGWRFPRQQGVWWFRIAQSLEFYLELFRIANELELVILLKHEQPN